MTFLEQITSGMLTVRLGVKNLWGGVEPRFIEAKAHRSAAAIGGPSRRFASHRSTPPYNPTSIACEPSAR